MNIFAIIGIMLLAFAVLRIVYSILEDTQPDFVVLTVHEAIALLPIEMSIRARALWFDYLRQTCSSEHPCVECRRDLRALERDRGA